MLSPQVQSLLGLAQRAGKVVSGEGAVEAAIKKGKVKLLILADDASANTAKLFRNLVTHSFIPLYVHGTKMELGLAIGKSHRSAVGLTDMNFVRGMKKHLDNIVPVSGEKENSGVD